MFEKKINPLNLLEKKLKYLNYCGLNPLNRGIFSKLYSAFLILMVFITLCLNGIYCLSVNYDEMGVAIINWVLFGALWQMFIKTMFFYTKGPRLVTLIHQLRNDFWSTEHLNKEQITETQTVYKMTALLDISFSFGVVLSIVGHCITAMIQGYLPANIWLPQSVHFLIEKGSYKHLIQAFEFIYVNITTLSCVLQGDIFLAIIIAMCLVQLKLIKYELIKVADFETKEERRKSLSEIILHHNLIFDMLAEVEDLFSPMILQLLGSSMFLVTISFLTALFDEHWNQKMLFFFVGVSSIGQLSTYCFLGQFVQDETESVARSAYMCNWENLYDKNLEQSVIIIIQRSQKVVNITMGNFIVLNLENLTTIARAMFSFFTFVINMKAEE